MPGYRVWWLGILTVCVALPLAVWAAPDDPWASVDPSGQRIVFWHNHTRSRQQALEALVEEFNRTNPHRITVVQENQGRYEDIFHKMLGLLNTPDVPDLVVAYQNQAATYQLGGALVDMTSLMNSPRWGLTAAEQQDFFPAFFQQDLFPTFNNARLGLAPNRSMEVLYYNRDWLQELGYEAPPATPEQFKTMACKALTKPFSKATVPGSMGYQLDLDASRLASWVFAFGGDVFDKHTGRYTYNSAATQQALSFLRGIYEAGCATVVTERGGDQSDFSVGRLLFTISSSSGLPFYHDAVDKGARFTWSVAALPHVTPTPVMNVYGASVSMPKTTPQRQLATWLFIKYYTSPAVQAIWSMASNYFPVRRSAAANLQEYLQRHPVYKAAFDLLPYSKYEPSVPGYDFVRDLVAKAMAAIVAQGAAVQPTLDKLNTESNAILAEQMQSLPPGQRPGSSPATTR
jgi:multiple sugar transport system substrate-binding protein/sn-glycerol 3-phosphate transport system substrate-binding protein